MHSGCQNSFRSCLGQRDLFAGKHWFPCCVTSGGEARKCVTDAHFKGKRIRCHREGQTSAWGVREEHAHDGLRAAWDVWWSGGLEERSGWEGSGLRAAVPIPRGTRDFPRRHNTEGFAGSASKSLSICSPS